jgi:long-chain acyl-CoA synthetase
MTSSHERQGDRLPTIHELFACSVSRYAGHVAVRNTKTFPSEPVEMTYAELDGLSDRVAAGLQRAGVKKGDRVAILSRPRIRYAAVVLGTLKAGGWLVPLDPTLTREEIAILIEHAGPRVVFAPGNLLERLPERGGVYVDLDDGADSPFSGFCLAEALVKPQVTESDIAILAYTSGTTGRPKGVLLSHGNVAADLVHGTKVIPILPDDVLLSIAPWHHILGLVACLILPLYGGGTAMYTDEYRRLAELMIENGVSIFTGVPKLFHGLYARLMEKVDGSLAARVLWRVAPRTLGRGIKKKLTGGRLRFFVSGSAPLDPKVAIGFRRMGIGMMEGYGLTETSPVISVCDPFGKKPGSVGRPLPHVEAKIVDPWPDGVGELLVRGPIVMQGYYNDPEATKEAIGADGWFHTGDLATLDRDGEIFLKGRAKNVIVLDSGKNVYPEELEWEIGRIPYVEEVLVRHRESDGEIEALVYPNHERLEKAAESLPPRELIWREIRARLQRLAPYKRLRSIGQLALTERPFPKTSTLDIKRHLFRRQEGLS